MYTLISRNVDVLLGDPKLEDAVSHYSSLLGRLRQVDVSRDDKFQKLYRKFWALNAARVNPHWTGLYFGILEREKHSENLDLTSIINDLRGPDGDGPIHLSFGSKLVHMIDPRRPIYDSLIADAYFFRPPVSGASSVRLQKLLAFYTFLQDEYARIVRDELLGGAISRFRMRFPAARPFTSEKVIDFLLWTCVRSLHRGAQQHGTLRYD